MQVLQSLKAWGVQLNLNTKNDLLSGHGVQIEMFYIYINLAVSLLNVAYFIHLPNSVDLL